MGKESLSLHYAYIQGVALYTPCFDMVLPDLFCATMLP